MPKLNRMSDLDNLEFVQTQGQALKGALSTANMSPVSHKTTNASKYSSKPKKKKKKPRKK